MEAGASPKKVIGGETAVARVGDDRASGLRSSTPFVTHPLCANASSEYELLRQE
jgi:hypothetical protein